MRGRLGWLRYILKDWLWLSGHTIQDSEYSPESWEAYREKAGELVINYLNQFYHENYETVLALYVPSQIGSKETKLDESVER